MGNAKIMILYLRVWSEGNILYIGRRTAVWKQGRSDGEIVVITPVSMAVPV